MSNITPIKPAIFWPSGPINIISVDDAPLSEITPSNLRTFACTSYPGYHQVVAVLCYCVYAWKHDILVSESGIIMVLKPHYTVVGTHLIQVHLHPEGKVKVWQCEG